MLTLPARNPTVNPGKRAPTAYNLWVKENLKTYKDAHPGVLQKDAMKAVCAFHFFFSIPD